MSKMTIIDGGSMCPNVNVRIVARNVKTGEITYDFEGHNRATKFMLLSIIRFINGEFNTSTPEQIQDYIPRYLALGSNMAVYGSSTAGITTEVTVNDTRLLSELDYERMRLTQRNIITNRMNEPYIKLTIRHYIPVDTYAGESLAEAGLFANKTGNNCLARIVFDRFTKDDQTVIDITWEITVVSMESDKEPYVSVDKQDLITSINTALDKIAENYEDIHDLCNALKEGVKDYGRNDATQLEVDEDTEDIQYLTYPLDNFTPIKDPVKINLGDVLKYDKEKNPKLTASSYPSGKFLKLNEPTFNMFGIFTNDGERTVIGFARQSEVTQMLEYSDVIYDDGTEDKWIGVNDLGIQVANEKLLNITTGVWENMNSPQIQDWDWSKDWYKKE